MTRNRVVALILTIALPVGIIAAGLFANFVLGALREKPDEKADPVLGLPVFVETVSRRDVSLSVNSQGEVTPRREAELSAQVAGTIVYVSPNLENGGFVRRGEVLTRIDDADFQLAAIRTESSVASARQALALAEAEAEIALKDWEEIGVGEPSALALRLPQLEEARAQLASAEAQAADAALQLSRTAIRAPFEGRIQQKMIELGQYVSPGRAVANMFATDVAVIELQLSNDELNDVGLSLAFNATPDDPGPEVLLSADAGGLRREWRGRIMRTGARVDSTNRLASVFVEVEDPFGSGADDGAPLAPGLFVEAVVEGRRLADVLSAPRAALRGENRVYVVKSTPPEGVDVQPSPRAELEFLHLLEVDVLRSTDERVYIRAGVDVGDRVIVSPVQAAVDGLRVIVIDDQPAATEPTSSGDAVASAGSRSGAAQ